jgi:hypothetical protein
MIECLDEKEFGVSQHHSIVIIPVGFTSYFITGRGERDIKRNNNDQNSRTVNGKVFRHFLPVMRKLVLCERDG